MVIRTQDSSAIYDCSKAFSIVAQKNGDVLCLGYSGELAYTLGHYESFDRAKEVVEEIFALIGSQDKYDMPTI